MEKKTEKSFPESNPQSFPNSPQDTPEVFAVAYGLGIDSTAMLVGLKQRGIRPDFILFADVGAEKQATYDYLPIIQEWLAENDFPPVTVVKYIPQRAPYTTIEGNMCMNCTLPGATFGRASCTMKWKIEPQDKWTNNNVLCKATWAKGAKVTKAIGFNADEFYRKNRASDKAHANDPKFDYVYPLQDWDWSRDECKRQIAAAGLPVPPKSACLFCPNQQAEELLDLTPEERGRVVRVEYLAAPYNKKVHGLWRRPRKADGRPGSITHYMIENGIPFVLPSDLPDEMPLNPACQKAREGWTFRPPHDAPDIRAMVDDLENEQHWDLVVNL